MLLHALESGNGANTILYAVCCMLHVAFPLSPPPRPLLTLSCFSLRVKYQVSCLSCSGPSPNAWSTPVLFLACPLPFAPRSRPLLITGHQNLLFPSAVGFYRPHSTSHSGFSHFPISPCCHGQGNSISIAFYCPVSGFLCPHLPRCPKSKSKAPSPPSAVRGQASRLQQ